jgi:mRNA interferase RelE/StbE
LSYRLAWTKRAQRDVEALEAGSANRVRAAVDELATEPRPHGCKKLRGGIDGYRIRIGDWRVIYDVDDAAKAVTVTRVGHRSEIYS